jgi:hypothetical protein
MHLQQGWVSPQPVRNVESLVPEPLQYSDSLSPSPMTYSTSQASMDANNSGRESFDPQQNYVIFGRTPTFTQKTTSSAPNYGAYLGVGPDPPSKISQFPGYISLYSAPGGIGEEIFPIHRTHFSRKFQHQIFPAHRFLVSHWVVQIHLPVNPSPITVFITKEMEWTEISWVTMCFLLISTPDVLYN